MEHWVADAQKEGMRRGHAATRAHDKYLENLWSRASIRPVSRWSRGSTGTVDCLISCVMLYPFVRTRSSQQLVVSDEKGNPARPLHAWDWGTRERPEPLQ